MRLSPAVLASKLALCFVAFSDKVDENLPDLQAHLESPDDPPTPEDGVEGRPFALPPELFGETRLGQELRLVTLFPELVAARADHGRLGVILFASDSPTGSLSEELARRIHETMEQFRPPGTSMDVRPMSEAPDRKRPILSFRDAVIAALHSPRGSSICGILERLFPHLDLVIHHDRAHDGNGVMIEAQIWLEVVGVPTEHDKARLAVLMPELSTVGQVWKGLHITGSKATGGKVVISEDSMNRYNRTGSTISQATRNLAPS